MLFNALQRTSVVPALTLHVFVPLGIRAAAATAASAARAVAAAANAGPPCCIDVLHRCA